MIKSLFAVLISCLLVCSPAYADYTPTVGDVVITYVTWPYSTVEPYPTVMEYCHDLANANIGGYHLDCDDSIFKIYYHAEFVNPETWSFLVDWCAENHHQYEVYRLGDWGDWQAAVDYQTYVYDYYGDRYRVPLADWDYLPWIDIDNQRYPGQSWYEYFHVDSPGFNKCYWYCISLTFDSIIHGWWTAAADKQAVVDYCNPELLCFFKNTLGGQIHDFLQSSYQRVYP